MRSNGHQGVGHLPVFAIYAVLVVVFSAYVVLDTFVISRTYAVVNDQSTHATSSNVAYAQVEDSQEAAEVQLQTDRYEGSSIYIAHIYTNDVHDLLAGFANDAYGRNVKAATSQIAASKDALVAINGDCYGLRSSGYVVRNGTLYRSDSAGADQEDLVIYEDGRFEIVCEGDVSAQELVDAGAWQVFSFGPGLIQDGEVMVDENDEVDRAMASNPRTAIGKVSDGHYVLVVSDGRTSESEGLSLDELATYMAQELGVECAYNLDGGGSSTMVYKDKLVNTPTSGGRSSKERSVSDIVYIAR